MRRDSMLSRHTSGLEEFEEGEEEVLAGGELLLP